MILTLTADRDQFEAALDSVQPNSNVTARLNSISDILLRGRFDEAWSNFTNALRRGYELGREKAQEYLDEAVQEFETLLDEAGDDSRELHEELLRRLRMFFDEMMRGCLSNVPSHVEVGGKTMELSKISMTQKLVVSGAVKLSLSEVFAFTSGGELSIAADYAG